MLELLAQGRGPEFRWRRTIPEEATVLLGRSTSGWSVAWDPLISRQHIKLFLSDEILSVEQLPDAANPVFFEGDPSPSFKIAVGQHFVIGHTTFTLTNSLVQATLDAPDPISRRTFTSDFLRQVRYRDADQRINALNRLPDIISRAGNDSELMEQLLNLLLNGIPSASSVAICRLSEESDVPVAEIVHWDRRDSTSGDFQPSARLITDATERQETTLHVWKQSGMESGSTTDYTMDIENDWAFVCPLNGSASRGLSLYVTGVHRVALDSEKIDIQGDVKFAELIGATLDNLRQVRTLERRQASLRPFFSPLVLEAFVGQDPQQVLAPRECTISVLFCDLRGFSLATEQMADRLVELLERVSNALGLVTRNVLAQKGVIGDFHGDSAMGFWGWPLDQSDMADRAATAAIDIISEMKLNDETTTSSQLEFGLGIGIATGVAVAGRIGTQDQVKVTAFGPTVNLASRLEGMTSQLRVPILIDQATANAMKDVHKQKRLRKLGWFQPYGLKSPSVIFQLLPEQHDLTPENIENYETALEIFISGDWETTYKLLEESVAHDAASRFLFQFIKDRGKIPPKDFSGIIELSRK